jgi:hypothetical protein
MFPASFRKQRIAMSCAVTLVLLTFIPIRNLVEESAYKEHSILDIELTLGNEETKF